MSVDLAPAVRPDILGEPLPLKSRPQRVDLSLVIPVYNEVESLPKLYSQLHEVLEKLPLVYEIVFIDDGSKDGTYEGLRDLHDRDPHIRVLSFRRNFGKTAALVAGFDYCRGDIIITMDADL